MSIYPNLRVCHENNIYLNPNESSDYNKITQKLLTNAEAYAKKTLGQPHQQSYQQSYQASQGRNGRNGADLLRILSSALDLLNAVLSRQNRSTKVYVGSNNGNKTTVYNNYSNNSSSEEAHARNKKAEQERSDRIRKLAGMGAVLLGGIGLYFLSTFKREIRESREAASEILNKREFFADVQDRNLADLHWVCTLHVRMLQRDEKDAGFSCLKAIGGIATAALMGTGAIFGSMLAIQLSGVCAFALGAKVLYDCFQTTDNSRANKRDAHYLLSLIQKLNDAKSHPLLPSAQNQWFKLGMNEENWRNADVLPPPSYEEAIRPLPSAPNLPPQPQPSAPPLSPQPSAPDLPPPPYTPLEATAC